MGAVSCRRRTSRRRCHAAALLAAAIFAAALGKQQRPCTALQPGVPGASPTPPRHWQSDSDEAGPEKHTRTQTDTRSCIGIAGDTLSVQAGRPARENLPVGRSFLSFYSLIDHGDVVGGVLVAAGRRPIRLPAAALARRRVDSSTAIAAAADEVLPAARRRWLLAGPGSSPPTCRARCGRCAPCRATRVAIQPGVGPQWEYYPEVWRCKCGNKLFMP
uniref:Epidermal patterning factor-like protein n=1 Tax=Zea mays TaxID=4577 RepID=A0A804P0T2_MAIZE